MIKSGKIILQERGSGTRMLFESKLIELGINFSEMKIYMEVGSIGAIKSLVESNPGYTIISQKAVKKEVEAGTLVVVPIEGVRIRREFNFIYLEYSPMDFYIISVKIVKINGII